jgi:hypothetical protein
MRFALGWVALALTGAGPAPQSAQNRVQIEYTVRFVEAEGLAWREAVCTHLRPVTRQGAATVWTAPRDVTNRLLEEVRKNPAARVRNAPKVTSESGAAVHIFSRANRHLVTQVAWHGDDRVAEVAPEDVRTGWVTTMVGRKLDQGILVQVVLEDTAIRAVHQVKCAKSAGRWPAAESGAARVASLCNTDCESVPRCSEAASDAAGLAIDVPEIGKQEIAGEWLISRDEFLVVSLGVYTAAGENGKAVVRDRLAIIGAAEVQNDGAMQRAIRTARPATGATNPILPPAPFIYAAPAPAAPGANAPKIPMPMPSVPSRTMPQGIGADGKPAELPPLPEDAAEAAASAEPMASPQKKKAQQPARPTKDAATDKAALLPPKGTSALAIPGLAWPMNPASPAKLQFLLPLRPFSFKLPWNQRLEIEIFGRLVPDTEAAGKASD